MRTPLVLAILALAGCGGSSPPSTVGNTTPSATAPPETEPAGGRAPTAEEIDRCASLLVMSRGCGLASWDFEYGFVKGAAVTVAKDSATEECSKGRMESGDDWMAVPVYDEAALAKLTDAHGRGCPAFEAALSEHAMINDSLP
jgi:hypothetical protein